MNEKLKLVLEDATEYVGYNFGYFARTEGEIVFNTGMIGYPETLTDPSYFGQILVETYPLIGNYGVPNKSKKNGILQFFESDKIQIRALIVNDYSFEFSHWNADKSLADWLVEEKIPAIYGIDTRALTRKLRDKGTMLAKIVFENENADFSNIIDPNEQNLVQQVSISSEIEYAKGKSRIILVDHGVKFNILREFLNRDISILRVPYNFDFSSINADGIVISSGPGDPTQCKETIEHTKKAILENKPILGICLGHQILGLAAGCDTYKLKYGHRSHNQPVNEMGTKRTLITTQNHGFAIKRETLPEDWREWFTNDNDSTNEGIIHISKPFFGTQFHPEANPGPDDTNYIFDMFIRTLK